MEKNRLIPIAIVDDHRLFRFALVSILKSDPTFQIVGEFSGMQPLMVSLNQLKPEVIITDLSMDNESGFDLIAKVKGAYPTIKVVVMSMHKDRFHIAQAMERGAEGYLYKDDKPEEVILAIKAAVLGKYYLSKSVADKLASIDSAPASQLTKKEREVVHFIMQGLASKQIAGKMKVSARTVEAHRYNILKKLGLSSITELVKLVAEHKIQF